MRRWRSALSAPLVLMLAACLGETPDRARITDARLMLDADRPELELTQQLRFSRTMREALDHGIALRLVYHVRGCGDADVTHVLELRHLPLLQHYELHRRGDTQVRNYTRRSALFASLDRIRLPLPAMPAAGCAGRVAVALDLTTLPTPLRFPALLQRAEWRLVSPEVTWTALHPRA